MNRVKRLAASSTFGELPGGTTVIIKRLLRKYGMNAKDAAVRVAQHGNGEARLEFRQTWHRAKFCRETKYVSVFPDYLKKGWPLPMVEHYEIHLDHKVPSGKPVRIYIP